jgi:hypothetical protein
MTTLHGIDAMERPDDPHWRDWQKRRREMWSAFEKAFEKKGKGQ